MTDPPGMLFHQLIHAHHHACAIALAAAGADRVGSPRLLMELNQYPDDPRQAPTQRELADRLHSAPATIAVSLKCLERAGYVIRWVDPSDSRRNRISITQTGRDTMRAGHRAFQQVDDCMYRGFSPEEREQIQKFLQRMLENLSQANGSHWNGEPCPPFPPSPSDSNERKCSSC